METCTVAENHQDDTRDQPLAEQNISLQWPISFYKGEGQATDQIPPVEPPTTGRIRE